MQTCVKWRGLVTLGAALLLALGVEGVASACPTCKAALNQNDPSHQGLVSGYFYSILFMMSMPFLLLGMFGSYAYLLVRRGRATNKPVGPWPHEIADSHHEHHRTSAASRGTCHPALGDRGSAQRVDPAGADADVSGDVRVRVLDGPDH